MWKIWPFLVSREAKPAPAWQHVAMTLLQTAAMWAFFLLFAPLVVFHLESAFGLSRFRFDFPGRHLAAALVFAPCGLLGIACGVIMAVYGEGTPLPTDCPRRLMIVGPYRHVRNPMAMSSLTQGLCAAVWLGSPLVTAYVIAGTLLWNFLARPWEEADLERRFGEPFRAYRRAVRCWLPRLRPYVPPQAVYSPFLSPSPPA